MTQEEANNMAKSMSYRQAICNALDGKCIPYRKATKKKLFELLEILEAQPCEDDERQESAIAVWLDLHRKKAQPCEEKTFLKKRTKDYVTYNVEWLKKHFDMEREILLGESHSFAD